MLNSASKNQTLELYGRCYGYLGLLPFLIGLLGPLLLPLYGGVFHHGFIIYSYLIFAFLSGTLWFAAIFHSGEASTQSENRQALGLGMAVLFSLLPFASFFIGLVNVPASVGLMALGYPGIWIWEGISGIRANYPLWYRSLRLQLTFVVTTCHLLFFFLRS